MQIDPAWLAVGLILAVGLPIDFSVLYLVTRLRKSQGRLNALTEMMPDLAQEDRKFVRWWMVESLKAEKIRQANLLEPGKRAPWEAP